MKNNKTPLIILTAGGSGGHVYPADALAEELSKRGYSLALVTDSRGKDNYKGKLGNIKNFSVQAGAMVGKSNWFKIKSLIKTAIGVLQSCYIIIKNKPKCIVGFGGYASFPCCVAAILLRKPLIIHEQNSVMSRTNRLLGKYTSLIATSFEDTKCIPSKKKIVLTGIPIRKEVIDVISDDLPNFSDPNNLQILIIGGSQGSQIFGTVIPKAISKLEEDLQKKLTIYHQVRQNDIEEANKLYKNFKGKIVIKPFFDEIYNIYKNTNLFIARAGSSSIYESLALGLPSIIIPLKIAADNHQTHNVKSIEKEEASIIIKEDDFNSERLYTILDSVLKNPKILISMSEKAKSLKIIDAATRFADAIEKNILGEKKC